VDVRERFPCMGFRRSEVRILSPRPQRRVHRGLAFLLHLRLSRDNCTEFLTLAYIQHYIFHAGKRPDPTVSPPFCKPIGGAGNGEVTVRFTSTLTICAEGTLTFLAGCMRLASNTRAKRAWLSSRWHLLWGRLTKRKILYAMRTTRVVPVVHLS